MSPNTTAARELALAARPRLYPVPAQGLTFATRAWARCEAEGRRRTWNYPGYDEDTPAQAGFATGLAYGIWGVRPDEAEALGQLAGHLTTHAMRVLPAPRYVVTALQAGHTAIVSVLARHGRAADLTNPGTHAAVRRLADSWGTREYAAGPCVFATARLTAA
ncbi:hypothetical protein ABT237_11770 [Streptomyces sp. NPDC001581]|uniref:hypothetical protein n=1 Tax=Streptomyces sp. NPDC001581 TaxID=3154386 RepID=UPI0033332244